MKYKVGDKVRVRGDLREGEKITFGVVEPMAAMAGSVATISEVREGDPDAYKLMEDPGGFTWSEKMFEPVEQFSSGGIVPVNDPRVTSGEPIEIETAYGHSFRALLQQAFDIASEFGTKKSTGIESRKDIRKRLLKL